MKEFKRVKIWIEKPDNSIRLDDLNTVSLNFKASWIKENVIVLECYLNNVFEMLKKLKFKKIKRFVVI